jgi:IclR family pca regulon transcriptional regulator
MLDLTDDDAFPDLSPEADPDRRGKPFVASVAKCFQVLKAFRRGQTELRQRDLGLSEICKLSGLDKSAAQRFSETLVTLGYLEKDPGTRRYRPGIALIDFYYTFMVSHRLAQIAMPILIEASKVYDTTVNLCELEGTDAIYTVRIPQAKASYGTMLAGRRVPAFCASPGTVLLAHMPEDEADAVLAASDLRKITEYTVTDIPALKAQMAEARRLGYHVSDQQSQIHNVSTAAPVLRMDGRAVAAVHIPGYAPQWNLESVHEKLVPLAVETARRISDSLTEAL